MTPDEKADRLFQRIAEDRASGQEVLRDLGELERYCTEAYQREKLRNAQSWAEIYFSPRKWQRWGSRENVRGFLLADIDNFRRAVKRTAT